MQHQDHVFLIRHGIDGSGETWADLGSGSGAFTLALVDLLGPTAHIYSVDQDARALQEQARAMRARFPSVAVDYLPADFRRKLDLPLLDGILIANALHYVRHKGDVLDQFHSYLRPGGRLVLVEYNTDHGNLWVPHPVAYPTWEHLAQQHGFSQTRLLATAPSRFLREMYAALSIRE